jgi:transcriptional regulator GlxA family with amidase domain
MENDAFAIVAKRLLREDRHAIREAALEMTFSAATMFDRTFRSLDADDARQTSQQVAIRTTQMRLS